MASALVSSIARAAGQSSLAIVLAAQGAATMSYGVTLPSLPFMLERRFVPPDAVAWQDGTLTGLYSFAMFLLSPP